MQKKTNLLEKDVFFGFLGNIGLAGIALYQMMLRDIFHFPTIFLYFCSILCIVTVVYSVGKGAFHLNSYPEYTWLIAFHIYMLVACAFSHNIAGSFEYWKNYSLDYLIMLCLIALLGMKKNFVLFIQIVGIGAIVMVAFLLFFPAMRYGNVRFRLSAESNPNYVGLIFAFGVWMIAYITKFRLFNFVLTIILMVLTAIAIMMTGSRKALITETMFFLFFFWNYLKTTSRNTRILSIILLVLFGGYIVGLLSDALSHNIISDRFASTFSSTTDEVRIEMYKNGIEAFLNNPIFGYGYEGYRFYFGGTYSHSNIIEVLVNGGVVGSFIYIMSFISLFRHLLETNSRIRHMKNSAYDVNEEEVANKYRGIEYEVHMVLALSISLVMLSFTLILIYSTLYQIYVALAVAGVYEIENRLNELESPTSICTSPEKNKSHYIRT